ncbi:hypothetical protein M426DRAFT_256756 [Hypoxylon sp. CI-4A]|nr:hypothetical protein M426DRAFT_256756 [Hypoxylon sp. CI-4A]
MSLTKLPNELLEKIFLHLDDGEYAEQWLAYRPHNRNPTLCAVARTCRQLSKAVVPVLYAEILFQVTGWNEEHTKRNHRRITNLNRSCETNPSLIDEIRSVRLEFGPIASAVSKEPVKFLGHLAKSKSLTSLQIWLAPGSPGLSPLAPLLECPVGSFLKLKDLIVNVSVLDKKDKDLSGEQFVKLSSLPSLEHLNLSAPIIGFKAPTELILQPTKLRKLRLCPLLPVSAKALKSVLLRSPNLESLTIGIPGDASVGHLEYFDNYLVLKEPLRPSYLGHLLSPVATSLKHLAIHATNVTFPSYDRSRINLSNFVKLETLEMTTLCLFGPPPNSDISDRPRRIWHLLLPRLERLSLNFDQQCMFWVINEASQNDIEMFWYRTNEIRRANWLLDLVDKTRRQMNTLKEIAVKDNIPEDVEFLWHNFWHLEPWSLPHSLSTAASEAGVTVTVNLAIPNEPDLSEEEDEDWEI